MTYKRCSIYNASQGYKNNRCSGYALTFILVEIFSYHNYHIKCSANDKNLGVYFYDVLCVYQEELLQECIPKSVSIRFVRSPANIVKGTCMILPSTIVHYCSLLGLSPILFYSSERKSIFETEIFEEDCSRMKEALCLVNGYDEFKQQAKKFKYLLALVRFQHWVSLKSTEEGYYLYDPAPKEFGGGVFGPGTFEAILPEKTKKYNSKYFYDILIGLCPIKN